MVKNKTSNSEDIHVKVDQNNLIYIDPNSTIDGDGMISPRNIDAEKLVMYANLEADLVPRSILASSNDTNTLTSIASGTLNFLKNGNGQDYDTTWTDSFLNVKEKSNGEFNQSDKTGQTFGINDINISIKGFNSIPTISINFIDIRGKTLFESPENSPYKAFFHIPWPIFYLTVKGFYGKAIKYRLHLVKFTTKFNESNGNFEVNTSFVGSTYAYLSDIPLQGILNAPYLFPHESEKVNGTDTKTGKQTSKLSKSSRGYEMLNTVYNEYKLKGLISNDFPVKTLREVLTIVSTLDKLLEKQIFGEVVDMRLFAAMKEFGEHIDNFEKSVRAWARFNLETTPIAGKNETDPLDTTSVFQSFFTIDTDKKDKKRIEGTNDGTLENLITKYTKLINESIIFSENLAASQPKAPQLINNTGASFTQGSLGISKIQSVSGYTSIDETSQAISVKIEKLVNDIQEIRKKFEEQREKLENVVQNKMNEIVSNKKNGFGFEPTIRNIFAVILSNAEVLIRLMKDVHKRAFEQAETRKKIVSSFSKESDGESIYPWPEMKATIKNKENTIIYPGDPNFVVKLDSANPVRWPEVAFIETYIGVSTNKVDPLAEKESGIEKTSFSTQNNIDEKRIKKISSANGVVNIIPYVNKLPDNFLYEIQERASLYTLFDTFSVDTIKQLAGIEYQNISESTLGERSLRKLLNEKIVSLPSLKNELEKLSPFEKYSYYKDSLPTTNYLVSSSQQPFSIEQYKPSKSATDDGSYSGLTKELLKVDPEKYRQNIYPFSSNTYKTYLKSNEFGTLLSIENFLEVDTTQGLISGQIDSNFWVKQNYKTNIFSRKFDVDKTSTNILNTPYFHKQLYNDFNTVTSSYGKYAGSAYLLLNSLPFIELNEIVSGTSINNKQNYNVLASSLFREVGSSQYVPYHLILKWGSIYHRYKKHIKDGIDILTGFTTSNTNTTPTKINGAEFFDYNTNLVYNTVSYTGNTNVGLHPYYDDIFYNVVNNVSYFNFSTGSTSGFTTSISDSVLNLKNDVVTSSASTFNYWTQFVNNESLLGIKTFTLLPSAGGNVYIGKGKSKSNEITNSNNSFIDEEQNHFRIVWDSDLLNSSYFNSGYTFSNPLEYETSIDGKYGLNNNGKKVMDLIATFSPSILDEFEYQFLNFASQNVNLNVSNKPYENVVFSNFQTLLREIVTLDKDTNDKPDISNQITELQNKQKTKLTNITSSILSSNNLIKITLGNPKELDPHVLVGFVDKDPNNTFNYNKYDYSTNPQLIENNKKILNLYLGPAPESFSGSTHTCYEDFFIDNDVEITEENVLAFRQLAYIYAGYKKLNNTTPNFKDYINSNILTPASTRYEIFMRDLIPKFRGLNFEEPESTINFFDGYNNKALKVELYNFFKSMNDKWIAGNSIGQRSLLEEFLFLDKANKDIGNDYYFDLSRLTMLGDEKNLKISLFSAISTLLTNTGFDMRALPAYINFYGTNFSNTPKIIPSKKIAQNLFGTFLEVDTQESSPKIIIQFVGKNSTRPDMSDKKNGKYKFTDDSYNIGNVNNNPVMITLPKVFKTGDLAKTNKVVAFEVSFGDQNQSIFKGIQLDQASIKNTSESFIVLENLARSESGSASHNVDIGLYEYYRQAAYTCDVTCMGNVMIQPTMYFYLKNIPMFKGTYWITEVSHSIRNGNITTTFKGSRMPYTALPDLTDSFMSSYKTLFDKIQKKAINRVNGKDKVTETTKTVTNSDGNVYTFDAGKIEIPNEKFVANASITDAGIPFNGFEGSSNISQVEYENDKWLRAYAVEMGSDNYQIQSGTSMSIIVSSKTTVTPTSGNTWSEISKFNDKYYFFATNFKFGKIKIDDNTTKEYAVDEMTKLKTVFLNPTTGKQLSPIETKFDFNRPTTNTTPVVFSGAIDTIRVSGTTYGIALSSKLREDLGLKEGDVVYFKMEK